MKHTPSCMKADELSLFCQQVELLLSAGLPLHDGMTNLTDGYANTPYAQRMTQLGKAVEETGSLYEGMKDSTLFPHYLREMVRIGETSGQLERVMHGMASHYDREDAVAYTVRTAVTYPLVLIGMMTVVVLVLVWRVLPIFRQVMAGLGEDLSGGSTLGAAGMTIGRVMLALVGMLLLAVLALALWYRFAPQKALRWLRKSFPMVAKLQHDMDASRFAGAMQMLLAGGFPLEESLTLMMDVFTDDEVRSRVADIRGKLNEGVSFPEAVEQSGIFDPLYGRMIRLGFDAGRTDDVMGKLEEVYRTEMDEKISRLVSWIEPALVTLLALVIGAILLSVMLPLAGLLGDIA